MRVFLMLVLAISLFAFETTLAMSQAEETDRILVTAERWLEPTRRTNETVYTGTEITARGMELQGVRALSSVWEAMKILPGVHMEASEGLGLGAEQRNVRIRGVPGTLGSLTLDGVPNYGANPIGPRDYIYDMENIDNISVFKGAVPADLGTGVGSRGGAIVLQPLWARENPGMQASQGLGSDSFQRSFGRLDSGRLGDWGTRLSISGSHSKADQWRGPGQIGPRRNLNATAVQPFAGRGQFRLWVNHNDLDQHLFPALDFSQVQNLSENRRFAYNAERTGIPGIDRNYFDFNRGTYKNTDFIGFLELNPSDALDLSFKPYRSAEDTTIFQGVTMAGGRVQRRLREATRTGAIAQAAWSGPELTAVLGYHYEDTDLEVSVENFAITPEGLVFQGFGVRATPDSAAIHSPHIKLAGRWSRMDWQLGLKYFRYSEGNSQGFVSRPPDFEIVPAPDLDRRSRTYDILLPTLGVGSQLTDQLYVYGSYGRNFIRPYMFLPLVNLYNNNRTTFQAQGIALDELFDGFDIERSENYDIGLRYTHDRFELTPTLFYARHRRVMTPLFDPRVNLTYNQNAGSATSHGLDLQTDLFLTNNLTAFANVTYTRFTYDDDLVFQGQTLRARGNQLVDTPELILRAGFSYTRNQFEIGPSLRYTGSRFGDVQHREEIDAFTLFDLRISYTIRDWLNSDALRISLEINNIFDKTHISRIAASDFDRGGSASYQVGAPRTAVLSASVVF
ncbi:MAG: TonB-dependent receptor [Wenzhouxiangella sp.]